MKDEARRSTRYPDFVPVSVFVLQKGENKVLAGPYPGTIIDICSYGACLLMSRVIRDTFHVFHSTRKNKSAYLQVKIESHPLLAGKRVYARPVWLNTFQREDFQERMIGIEFLADTTEKLELNNQGEKQ